MCWAVVKFWRNMNGFFSDFKPLKIVIVLQNADNDYRSCKMSLADNSAKTKETLGIIHYLRGHEK